MKAIIGGTGIEQEEYFSSRMQTVKTIYGETRLAISDDIIYLPRHSEGHSVVPHMVNYKANIQALVDLGVTEVVSIYAVGSITNKLPPLCCGIVTDFIDVSGRTCTFYDHEVYHAPLEEPFDRELQEAIYPNLKGCVKDLIYIMTQGPRFETKAEIRAFRNMGADVVGQTLATEASLFMEKGIRNVAICYSVN